jgi:hypothetical protein
MSRVRVAPDRAQQLKLQALDHMHTFNVVAE